MEKTKNSIDELIKVMDKLLSPNGCPWDREQTHQSLTRYLIEESYEVVYAIKSKDMAMLKDELGDLLLQVVFHAALAERAGQFDFADVADSIRTKMINRHPHVFGDLDLKTSYDVMDRWEGFKKEEGKKRLLEGIPPMLPGLLRAMKLQEKAARVGFDWPEVQGALEKFKEEIDEVAKANSADEIREEIGDLLFALVNVARIKGVDPEEALQDCNDKFVRRFNYIEDKIKGQGKDFHDFNLAQLDIIWDEAKSRGL
ncbi:MAG: nucleoside triphosphate pyrophosphohydrolase [Syntrophomonadaceae bacterium]